MLWSPWAVCRILATASSGDNPGSKNRSLRNDLVPQFSASASGVVPLFTPTTAIEVASNVVTNFRRCVQFSSPENVARINVGSRRNWWWWYFGVVIWPWKLVMGLVKVAMVAYTSGKSSKWPGRILFYQGGVHWKFSGRFSSFPIAARYSNMDLWFLVSGEFVIFF